MEISSTREAISAEATHETKTTGHTVEHTPGTSDNANLLDVKQIGKAGRLVRYILVKSAAQV